MLTCRWRLQQEDWSHWRDREGRTTRPGARGQSGGSSRGQNQGREGGRRQVVRRQRLRFWQRPVRRDCLHPRQSRACWRGVCDRNGRVDAGRGQRRSCRGRILSTKRLGTKRLEGGEGQEKGEQSGSTSEAHSGTDSRTGSSVGKESRCGVRSPAGTSRRARRALCVA